MLKEATLSWNKVNYFIINTGLRVSEKSLFYSVLKGKEQMAPFCLKHLTKVTAVRLHLRDNPSLGFMLEFKCTVTTGCKNFNCMWIMWFFQWSCMDVRVGLQRKLSTKELMLLNCGVGEDS